LPSCSRGLVILQPAVELSPSGPRLSDATRLSDDPQCRWRPPRIRLPSRKVLVCRRYFRFFRQVADKSPPRAEGSHPNPCLPLRVRPFLMAQADKIRPRCDNHRPSSPPDRSGTHLNRILDVFAAGRTTQAFTMLALSRRLWGLQRRPAAAKDGFLVSKEVQLRAAVAPRGFALPQHLNLMSSDAGNRTGSAALAIVLAHPDDTVA